MTRCRLLIDLYINSIKKNNLNEPLYVLALCVICSVKVVLATMKTRESLSSRFTNNTVANQPAHPRSLISAFSYMRIGKYHI